MAGALSTVPGTSKYSDAVTLLPRQVLSQRLNLEAPGDNELGHGACKFHPSCTLLWSQQVATLPHPGTDGLPLLQENG